ncbi:MAG: RagB/SusD family nutrient uptake outer membrane protein [Tannerellaceae bacterium]|nr:RagB/SusD family nutrient uptake outer membrane protein [Tannerellaceae bacterium]
MKLRYLLFTVGVFAAFLSGCQDLTENPKADLTPGTYYQTPQELEGTIAAMYRVLCPDDAWGYISGFASYFGSDDLATHPASNKGDFRDFDRLQGDAGNGGLGNNQWRATWKSIYQANAVLSVIDGVSFSTEAEKNGAAGQAYYMRGLCYFYLVRTFGELPIITESIDVDDRPDRQPIADVYTQILEDLTLAESLLPESWPGQPGKANKYAAKALLSDVYLTMTGWPLNQSNYYASSAEKANDVIQSGKYQLVPEYGDVFKTNNNSEAIFALQFNTAGGLARRSTGQFCVPQDETSLAGEEGWHDFCTEVNFFRKAPKCKRTDDTFLTVLKIRKGSGSSEFDLVPWDDPERTSTQHPYFKKFRYGVAAPGTTVGDGMNETEDQIIKMSPSTDKTLDVIRYPAVLLNYAEASAMAGGGPTAAGYDAINQVRKRAGLPDLTAGLSQTAFRDSVVFERAYEFAGEMGIRWFDIVRLQLLPQIIAERVVGAWQKDQYWENELNPTYSSGDRLQSRYLAPIPQSEMDRNPGWTQNPGY